MLLVRGNEQKQKDQLSVHKMKPLKICQMKTELKNEILKTTESLIL